MKTLNSFLILVLLLLANVYSFAQSHSYDIKHNKVSRNVHRQRLEIKHQPILNLKSTFNTKQSLVLPPTDLKLSHEITDSFVYMSWWNPGTPHWLYYHNNFLAQSIGLGEAAEFDVAVKYTAEQLAAFQFMKISEIGISPTDDATTYTLRVWKGEGAAELIHEQLLSGLVFNEMNNIKLDSSLTLDVNSTYYFGYHCITEGYPAGCDAGPVTLPGSSDLIRFSDTFESLFEISGMALNWNIQVYMEPTAGAPIPPDYFNVYRNNEVIDTAQLASFTDKLELSGNYTYAISAVYGTEESGLSNAISTVFDNERIQRNAVVMEGIVDVNSQNCVGIELGYLSMIEDGHKVAPILYHWAYMGQPDPFDLPLAQERASVYMDLNMLSGFPVTVFDGEGVVQGGSSSTLYDVFTEVYEEQINKKTPLAMESFVEAKSGSSFVLNVKLNQVGMSADLSNLVQHTIVVQNTISNSWQGLSESNFVARHAFPGSSGTNIALVDYKAELEIDINLSPMADNSNSWVVTFAQDKTTGEIWNADYIKLPGTKRIVFKTVDNSNILENVSISVLENSITSNQSGIASLFVSDNLDSVNYVATKSGYNNIAASFNPQLTDTVLVDFSLNSIVQYKQELKYYPNPVHSNLNIEGKNITNIKIFALDGKLVFSESFKALSSVNIDLSGFPRGVYIATTSSHKRISQFKIIKE